MSGHMHSFVKRPLSDNFERCRPWGGTLTMEKGLRMVLSNPRGTSTGMSCSTEIYWDDKATPRHFVNSSRLSHVR